MTALATPPTLRFPRRHLLGIEGLSADEITMLLDLAESYVEQNRKADKKTSILRSRWLDAERRYRSSHSMLMGQVRPD